MNLSEQLADMRNQSPEQLLATASQILPPWIAILLAVAIAWQLTKVTLLLLSGEPSYEAAAVPGPSANAAGGNADTIDIQNIVDAHIFGKADPKATVIVRTDKVEELKDGKLVLKGTIAATDDRKAVAIIEESRGEEKVYTLGENVPGGGKLHAVKPTEVVFEQRGKLLSLKLPEEFRTSATSRSTTSTRRRSRPTLTGQRQNDNATPEPRSVQDVISADPAALTDIIRPQPVFADGKQRGYRVYPGRKRAEFTQLGLKPGDLVTEINGAALTDPAQGMEIFRSLGESSQVSVTVERNGQPEVLVLDTAALASGLDQ